MLRTRLLAFGVSGCLALACTPAPPAPTDAGVTHGDCSVNNGGCALGMTCVSTIAGISCFENTAMDSGSAVDSGPSDSGTIEDAGPPDAGTDAGSPDAGTDAGPVVDAGPPDSGPVDSGPLDAGPPDSGPVDAGEVDAGPIDAGTPDSGPTDAGPPDAGPIDAGPQSTLQSNTITGTLAFDPLELQWRGLTTWTPSTCANGQAGDGTPYDLDGGSFPFTPPCTDGDSVSFIDQIRQSNGGDPLGSTTVSGDSYTATRIDLVNTTLGLLGAVTDPSSLAAPSVSIVALPAFTASGTQAAPTYLLTTAFMQHVAHVIGMTYDAMMMQGVALIHIVSSDGVTPVAGDTLYSEYGVPVGATVQGFSQSTGLTKLPFSQTMTSAPFVYYLSADTNGVLANPDDDVSTSASGLVVIVGPPPLINTQNMQTEMAYTANTDWGPIVVFGTQPGAVVDVFLPDQ